MNPAHVGIAQRHHEVDIVGEARFAIDQARHRAGHEIGNAEHLERASEQREQFMW